MGRCGLCHCEERALRTKKPSRHLTGLLRPYKSGLAMTCLYQQKKSSASSTKPARAVFSHAGTPTHAPAVIRSCGARCLKKCVSDRSGNARGHLKRGEARIGILIFVWQKHLATASRQKFH